jgi:hypothetical protein
VELTTHPKQRLIHTILATSSTLGLVSGISTKKTDHMLCTHRVLQNQKFTMTLYTVCHMFGEWRRRLQAFVAARPSSSFISLLHSSPPWFLPWHFGNSVFECCCTKTEIVSRHSGQLLTIVSSLTVHWILFNLNIPHLQVQDAIDKRVIDKGLLMRVAAGRLCCTLAIRLLSYCKTRLALPLDMRIKKYYSVHIFHAFARLDVPTFDDPVTQRGLERSYTQSGRSSIAWDTVVMTINLLSTILQLVSEVSVLIDVLHDQQDGPLLAVSSFSHLLIFWLNVRTNRISSRGRSHHRLRVSLSFDRFFGLVVWAATTNNDDYVRMQGMKKLINDASHRKEVVAGSMSEHLTARKRDSLSSYTLVTHFATRVSSST